MCAPITRKITWKDERIVQVASGRSAISLSASFPVVALLPSFCSVDLALHDIKFMIDFGQPAFGLDQDHSIQRLEMLRRHRHGA